MIIFDLDGTLADCQHRRHFVDINYSLNHGYITAIGMFGHSVTNEQRGNLYHSETKQKWKPDWPAFYEACDKDKPIEPVVEIWNYQISQGMMGVHQIWSGRCESVRKKTEEWIDKNLLCFEPHQLKMRPIGDNAPDDVLKERWLDESIADGKTIDFVFDDRLKVVRMWRRRGIFVFNCCQHDGEF